jgi:hypothetical protein
MKFSKILTIVTMLAMVISIFGVTPATAVASTGVTGISRTINRIVAHHAFPTSHLGAAVGVQNPEIFPAIQEGLLDHSPIRNAAQILNRSHSLDHASQANTAHMYSSAPNVADTPISGSVPRASVIASFDGLNHFDQRYANGGNQFSLEPPDQGLCAGNGYVMEIVNDVMNVYDTSGADLTGAVDLNTFYGYPAQIDRTNFVFGPFVTDPSCYYDPDTQHWFADVLTLDVDSGTGAFLGTNHLDLAVSDTSDPTGNWTIYSVPVQDDGTDGTPNHSCTDPDNISGNGTGYGPCLGDYPHIGADQYGIYLTTNEYSFFGPEFKAAQVYAFSKNTLATLPGSITVTQFDTTGSVNSVNGTQPGFTIWPAESASSVYATDAYGTEYFMSSNAGEEASGVSGGTISSELVVWAMTNTSSLDSSPSLTLDNLVISSESYSVPPISTQKPGSIPLVRCLNTVSCANVLWGGPDPFVEHESQLDSNDSRMQQVRYTDGLLWGALDTPVVVKNQVLAGIAYFIVNVSEGSGLSASVNTQGYMGVAKNNITYPALAILPNGNGIMAFTLVGKNYFPSAAYAYFTSAGPVGPLRIAKRGAGPDDGFSGTFVFNGGVPRPRWGDYGSAVTDGNNVWIASEFIGQVCGYGLFKNDFTCHGTRTALANWDTHITGLTP